MFYPTRQLCALKRLYEDGLMTAVGPGIKQVATLSSKARTIGWGLVSAEIFQLKFDKPLSSSRRGLLIQALLSQGAC